MIVDELVAILGYDVQDEAELKRFQRGLDDLTRQAEQFGAAIGRTMAIAGAAFAAGFTLLGKSVLETGAQFETLSVRLEALEGSAEKASSALEWIRNFAETTPLSLSEAANAYAQLRTFGIEPTTGALQSAVDTMAMSGQGASYLSGVVLAMGQAWSKGKLQGEEALQLIERGIPVWQLLADELGVTTEQVQKMSEKGKLGRDVMLKLFDAMGRRAAGASAKAAKTWTGLIGRLGDQWEGFKKTIADDGFFDVAKGKLEELVRTFDGWAKDGTMEWAARGLSRAFIGVADAIGILANRVKTHFSFIRDNFSKFEGAITALGWAIAGLMVRAFPLIAALLLVGLAVEDVLTYMEGGESVFGDFVAWIQNLIPVSEDVARRLAAIFTGLGIGIATALAAAPLATSKLLVGGILRALAAIAVAIASSTAGIVAAVAVLAAAVAGGLIYWFWEDFRALWPETIGKIEAAFAEILTAYTNLGWFEAGATAMTKLWEGLQSIGAGIRDWFASLMPDWAKGVGAPAAGAPATGENPMLKNLRGNMNKMSPQSNAAAVGGDSRTTTNTVTVEAPVTVHVQQASQAPAAAGAAIAAGVRSGVQAQPARMQQGPVQ